MGNTANNNALYQYQNTHIWKIVAIRNNYSIIKNIQTNIEYQQYTIPIIDQHSTELSTQTKVYQQRKNMENGVKCIDHFQEKDYGLCKFNSNYKVITQRITRLKNVQRMDKNEGKTMLKQCIKGYSYLCQRFGWFDLNNEMFGLNKQGRVKLWINSNFGLNNRQYERQGFNQQAIIKQIHTIISQKVRDIQFYNILLLYSNNNKITFQNTIKYINLHKWAPHQSFKPIPNYQLKIHYINPKPVLPTPYHPNNYLLKNSKYAVSSNLKTTNATQSIKFSFKNNTPTNTSDQSNYKFDSQLNLKPQNPIQFTSGINLHSYNNMKTENSYYNNIGKQLAFTERYIQDKQKTPLVQCESPRRKMKLDNIARVDSILMVQKQQQQYWNEAGLQQNVEMIQSLIIRS